MNRKPYTTLIQLSSLLCVILLGAQTTFAGGLEEQKRLSFTVPGAPWTMTLPAANFVLAQQQVKPNGTDGYFYLNDRQSHLNVSFFIEPVRECNTSKTCRDLILKSGNPSWENPQDFVSSQLGDVYYFEFMMASLKGVPFQQQNLFAEFVVDGYWVDMHMSKVLYEPRDHVLFEDLIKATKFEPKEKPAKDPATVKSLE